MIELRFKVFWWAPHHATIYDSHNIKVGQLIKKATTIGPYLHTEVIEELPNKE